MNRPRKKAEYLLLAGLLALFIVTGCAHGKGDVAQIDTTEIARQDVTPDPDQGIPKDGATSVSDGENTVEQTVAQGEPSVSDGAAPEDVSEGSGEDPLSEGSAASTDEDFIGGDDVDDFFDDPDPLTADTPVTQPEELVPDPLITFNRAMFTVNDRLYFWCLKPVAQGYKKVTPSIVRKGVRNFFNNLGAPVRLVGSVLQGKFKGAGSELGRFLVNSTVGIAGIWDPAEMVLGLKPSDEDLGQALGSYNIDNGIYIVWPVFGPSTLRDSVGRFGEIFLNPLYYLNPNELAWGLKGLDTVNDTSYRIGDYETVKSTYMDPYVMIRDFYITHRKKKIAE